MKRFFLCLFILGIFLVLGGCANKGMYNPKELDRLCAAPSKVKWPSYKIDSFVLKNGVKVYLLQDHELPLIHVDIRVKGGGFLVPSGKEGLEDVLAQMMRLGGSRDYPGDKLDSFLEDRGAELSVYFGFLFSNITLDTLSENFKEIFPQLVEILCSPNLNEGDLLLAKQRLRTIIMRRNDSQDEIAMREFKRLIYGRDTIYGRLPTLESVASISLSDVESLYNKIFVAPNIYVGVVGDFDVPEMKAFLEEKLGSLRPGDEIKIKLPSPHFIKSRRRVFIDKKGTNQSFIVIGHRGGFRQSPDFAPLQVMNMILSGGFSGRLFENIRTKMGLAYAVFGRFGCRYFYPGIFFVGLKTKNGSTARAIEAVERELDRLKKKGVSEKEVREAKMQFLNTLVFRYDSPQKVMERRLYYSLRGMSPDSFIQLIKEIERVNRQDVDRVARKYIHEDWLKVLVVGDRASLEKQLSVFGKWESWVPR